MANLDLVPNDLRECMTYLAGKHMRKSIESIIQRLVLGAMV